MSKLKVDQISKATGAAPAIFTLPAADGSADQTLKTDGSGQLGWSTPPVAGTNTPAWHVGIDAAQTIPDGSTTKVELDDVKFNSGFTWDTSGYKGTPGTAGKYLIGCFADLDPSDWGYGWVYLYKNGASQAWWGFQEYDSDEETQLSGVGGSTIIDLSATDYVEMFVHINYNSGSSTVRRYDATQCVTYMYGMKLIGA